MSLSIYPNNCATKRLKMDIEKKSLITLLVLVISYFNCTILIPQFQLFQLYDFNLPISIEPIESINFSIVAIRSLSHYAIQFLISKAYVAHVRLIWH